MIDVPDNFLAFLQNEEDRARMNDLSEERSIALDFYNGEPFGDEEDGRSQLVTRDVAETVDHMTVSVLDTLVSGDRVVEFEPGDEGEEQAADDATEAVMYHFMRKQKGYAALHDWLKAGLLEKSAVMKVYAEPQPDKRVEREVPAEALAMLQEENINVVAAEPIDPEETMWRVAILEPQPPKIRALAVPNEECLIAADTRDMDEGIYAAHRTAKTLSDLRQMGLDVEGLEAGGLPDNVLAISRDAQADYNDDRDGPNRKVWLLEEYVRFDLNGDGIAEMVCVHRVGSKILSMEECDEQPFVPWCPFPMQHRLIGQSLADKTMDLQRTRSVVLRQTMDGFYFANAPRTYVNTDGMDDNTIDDLLTVRPGQIVRWKGAHAPKDTQTRFDTSAGLSMLELLTGERESRTGITRLNQGLDRDALNKTASGTAMMQEQGQQVEKYIARNIAEPLAVMFGKMYRLLKRTGVTTTLRVDGVFRRIDPAEWPEEMEVVANVGLGTGDKGKRIQGRTLIGELQKLCMEGGLPIVSPREIYNNVKGLVKDLGLGSPNDYFIDPETIEQQPQQEPPPDPELVKVQMEQQAREAEMRHKQQMAEVEKAIRANEGAEKLAQMRAEREEAAIQARQRIEDEYELGLLKQQREQELAERKMLIEERLAQARMSREAQMADAKMSQNRPGGDLDK